MSHTPGPWKLRDGDQFQHEKIVTTDARMALGVVPICEIGADFVGAIGVEQEANARLITAAPELLEALTEALNQLETLQLSHKEKWSNDRTNMVSAARIQGRAAIAKATGEQP